MFLEHRYLSQQAHKGLTKIKNQLNSEYYGKASGLVQGLNAYIATWGLHRLAGDANKFLAGTAEDTTYKGKVYRCFLESLESIVDVTFDPKDESSLIYLPLPDYTAVNRLAMQLAKEWSFWAPAVLGEAKE